MEHSFWHSKWNKNEIGFHEPEGNALLVKYSHVLLNVKSDTIESEALVNESASSEKTQKRIFVPLCGKTKDIAWLLSKGCEVVGAELSEIAITQLFEDLNLTPTIESSPKGKVYSANHITIFVGDIFKLTPEDIGEVTGVYDRAALVALPNGLRERYAEHMVSLTRCAPQLLITFDYQQSELQGPPFCVSQSMVENMYKEHYAISLLERSDLEGGLKKKVKADNLVFTLSQ